MTDLNIGRLIHDRRIELGLTMKMLADKCHVSEATVSRWESGEIKNMRRDAVANLAKALQINPKVLMNWGEGNTDYYIDAETAKLAQELKDHPHFRVMFDSTKDLDPKSVKEIMEFIKFKRAQEGLDD